jgi:hypothetical protein
VSTVLDHVVVAAPSLDDGLRWCQATLGITPGPGGRHALMGTHNHLFNIASPTFPNAYFEIIAIDPDAPAPQRARWFGLDAMDWSTGPRLIHWVARTSALDTLLAALRTAGVDAGRAITASRHTPQGLLSWRIAVRDDGALLHSGALPTLIEWGDRHPAQSMPASGVVLRSVILRGLAPQTLTLDHIELRSGPGPALTVELDTPLGPRSLSS